MASRREHDQALQQLVLDPGKVVLPKRRKPPAPPKKKILNSLKDQQTP